MSCDVLFVVFLPHWIQMVKPCQCVDIGMSDDGKIEWRIVTFDSKKKKKKGEGRKGKRREREEKKGEERKKQETNASLFVVFVTHESWVLECK